MKKILGIFLVIIFAITAFSQVEGEKDWTVMIYMAADNEASADLEGDGWIDIREMLEANVDESKINVVFESDFGSKGNDGRYIIKDGKFTKVKGYDEINLGDPKTLKTFIEEVKQQYPAKKYMIDFWGHGTGTISIAGPGTIIHDLQQQQDQPRRSSIVPSQQDYRAKVEYLMEMAPDWKMALRASSRIVPMYKMLPKRPGRSFAYDESSKDSITLAEVKAVLDETDMNFELIAFDACIMNELEVHRTFRDHTKYITSAITNFPGGGYFYTGWLKYLSEHPRVEGRGLAEAILASNKDFYTNIEKYKINFALTVAERIKKNLRNNPDDVLAYMQENNIPEDQFEAFINTYASQYVQQNMEALLENAEKAFKVQPLNFGMIYLKNIDGVIASLNELIKNLDLERDLPIIAKARQDSEFFNEAFGPDYGNLYMDTMTFTNAFIKNSEDENMVNLAKAFKEQLMKLEPKKIVINSYGKLEDSRSAIFFPENIKMYNLLGKYYKPLDFAKDSLWDEFLEALLAQEAR